MGMWMAQEIMVGNMPAVGPGLVKQDQVPGSQLTNVYLLCQHILWGTEFPAKSDFLLEDTGPRTRPGPLLNWYHLERVVVLPG